MQGAPHQLLNNFKIILLIYAEKSVFLQALEIDYSG